MTMSPADALTLRIERFIRAPQARVYALWTNPAEMDKWNVPEGMTVPEAEQDIRVGGKFRAVLMEADGTRHTAVGEYREVTPPERLVYTHAWLTDDETNGRTTPQTIVTVEFLTENDGTRVVLTQTGFANKASRDGHEGGWSSTLDQFARMFRGE